MTMTPEVFAKALEAIDAKIINLKSQIADQMDEKTKLQLTFQAQQTNEKERLDTNKAKRNKKKAAEAPAVPVITSADAIAAAETRAQVTKAQEELNTKPSKPAVAPAVPAVPEKKKAWNSPEERNAFLKRAREAFHAKRRAEKEAAAKAKAQA